MTVQPGRKNAKRIVVKIGSSLFYTEKKKPDLSLFDSLSSQIARLVQSHHELVVVSSGAIALGMSLLKLETRPKELSRLQAAAAVGQNELMKLYGEAFKKHGILCAQVLLTWDDFTSRTRYLNAVNTLDTVLKLGCVPVINENDTVSTDEIRFGDNDQLSSLVAALVSADLLVILSDVEGLLDKDKKTVVRTVVRIDSAITALAGSTQKQTSVGGMASKLKAAKMSQDSGIPCVIAAGRASDVLVRLADDLTCCGTHFVARKSGMSQKQRWIAFSAKPKGSIVVDDGAKKALREGKSLLCVGVTGVEGLFSACDVVRIKDKFSVEFARGKAGLSCTVLAQNCGSRFQKEAMHRDNIVLLE